MFSSLNLTDYLAFMFGLYLVAAGIGLLLDGDEYQSMLDEFYENPALGYIGAILVFALGVVVVRLHNDWSSFTASLVSFVGWAMLVEGFLLLAVRRQFLGFFAKLNLSSKVYNLFGLFAVIAGASLIGSLYF
ncbi:hypothetical protein NBRC116602_12640 [Hyphomicrobiales bacterium 4NK60-0047b]